MKNFKLSNFGAFCVVFSLFIIGATASDIAQAISSKGGNVK